jgi:serine/threonine protein kinase
MGADAAAEEQFGPYLVYERLGVGGMATVHRALEHGVEGFERVVALKRLLPHLAEDASFIKAFVREAKLASLLNHVNIVQIYELGRVGTEYFISMEYIDGRDVRRILRHARKVTGPPPIHVTVGLMIQLCDALDYAHAKVDDDGHPLGLVHRDVSPSNLLITSQGNLKVIDFGIAKAQSSQLRTQTGRVKGKLAYMAPEAVSGSRDLDARSDLWAAGVILHELLTARPLFASKNEYQTLLKVQRGDIMPPSTFNQACPPELDAIVFRALARDPDDRFADAGDLRDELLAVRHRYQLATRARDLATWLDWAFALEVPAGFSGNTLEPSQVSPLSRGSNERARSRPRNRDDDEAVEIAWGPAEADAQSGPVVLDDVPDVSGKHLPVRPSADEIDDDIPTPQPSHGTVPRKGNPPSQPPLPDSAIARGTDPPRGKRNTAPGIAPARPSDKLPVSRADSPNMSARLAAQRARDSEPPALRNARGAVPSPLLADNLRTDPDGHPMVRAASTTPALAVEDLFDVEIDDDNGDDAASTLTGARAADTLSEGDAEPVVRFGKSKQMAAAEPPADAPLPSGLASLRPAPRTKPGVQPAAARKERASIAPATEKPVIGASMVERHKQPSRKWILVLGLVLLAGGGATLAWFAMAGSSTSTAKHTEPPPALGREPGTVKFVTEPADAEVRVEGQTHTGSPWSLELAPGTHQIEIHRSGYKAWLTSLELAPRETSTLRVVLEPLGKTPASSDATLSITTTPAGLEVILDGQKLAQLTPIKMPIKPGTHIVAVKKGGLEVWHQNVNAEAASDYAFNPSFVDAIPKRRTATDEFIAPEPKVDKHDVPVAPPPPVEPPKPVETPDAQPAPVSAPVAPPPPVEPPKPVATPTPPPPPPAQKPGPPITVAPNAVSKLSGDLPNIARFSKTSDLPAMAPAKLCIDTNGHVTSADFIGKLEKHVAADLSDALRTWRYAPYIKGGVALAACFVVTVRIK